MVVEVFVEETDFEKGTLAYLLARTPFDEGANLIEQLQVEERARKKRKNFILYYKDQY